MEGIWERLKYPTSIKNANDKEIEQEWVKNELEFCEKSVKYSSLFFFAGLASFIPLDISFSI